VRIPYVVVGELLLLFDAVQILRSEVSTAFECTDSLAVGVKDGQEHVPIGQYRQLHCLLNQPALPLGKTDLYQR
jgi:hypothetical protein